MRLRRSLVASLILLGVLAADAGAVAVPANFVVENAVPGATFNQPTAIAWLPGGRMLVLEKAGLLWSVTAGVKSGKPMIDLNKEVFDNADRGALGLAVDPNYLVNHYVYLMYEVDPDTNGVDTNSYGFGRITRYQVSFTDSTKLDTASRTILMGVDWPNGPVSASTSHGIGDLRFGSDGSLLASNGDGASFSNIDAGGLFPGAFGPGKTDPSEDIGAFRSQDILSLNGKILRIDPATGHGYPSNPYWDGNPMSVRSRVWVYGLRNPFRFSVKPGTGSTDPAAGNPGTLYIGDVGMNTWEETNIATAAGLNFGWPCYEGAAPMPGYQAANPPAYGCNTIGTSVNPGPLTAPAAYWNHSSSVTSTPPGFYGNCSTGGVWYTGTTYPGQFKNKYFFCDYGQNWIDIANVDANDNITSVVPFGTGMDAPVCLRTEPVSGELYYVSITTGQVRHIRYSGPLANTPVPIATGTPLVGVAPLTVNFDGSGSYNPTGQPFTLTWLFGDGQGSTATSPSHAYTIPGRYAAVLTADDGQGGVARDTLVVIALNSATFPTAPVLDNFNRANGPLTTPWVDPVDNLAGLSVSSNALAQACCAYGTPCWGGASFGPNQEAFITLTSLTSTAPEYDLMLKLQAPSYNTPHFEVRYDNTTKQVLVSTWDPASGWIGLGGPIAVTMAAGDRFGARAYENGIVEVYRNGALIGTRDGSAWSYARFGGYLGLTLDQAYTSKLDDFGGGDIVINPNTKPTATIDAPANLSFYSTADSVRMSGHGTDAQQTAASLSYDWDVYLHHNNHTHPDQYITTNTAGSFMPEDHEDGTGVYYELRFWVTDNQGLADTTHVDIYPEVNLTPAALQVSPPTPEDHGPAFYSFWLRNLGRMRSRYTHWVVRADGAQLAAGDTLVEARDSVMVNAFVTSGPAQGSYTLRVKVDSLDVQRETDETDNAMTMPLTITAPTTGAGAAAPRVLALSAARPNPSAGAVWWSLDLPRAGRVEMQVYDLMGRVVWSDGGRDYGAGRWSLRWDGADGSGRPAATGVYLVKVRAADGLFVRRVAILR